MGRWLRQWWGPVIWPLTVALNEVGVSIAIAAKVIISNDIGSTFIEEPTDLWVAIGVSMLLSAQGIRRAEKVRKVIETMSEEQKSSSQGAATSSSPTTTSTTRMAQADSSIRLKL